ncbi:MAG TPA: DEAD/DEAH box helicase [Phycisphaerae bacterium]|jgi:superfamily II DNA/RNA helicase|nr:DEAD/DEAH box helicase [Phycisphaerae bacterium]HOB76708.1 DEAD/DEAH box helicase [Phycisphaerae bacterium]HOJ56736.1 DEAD/DEAH box helicase [Phycisphaerae bacterium]HOL27868.1 DEAD/DEAH box helicase [Phycisphaerae bacterium]HPP19650.1 DEAD/DEAH box helicase [Phycisphaerae bacterium]
MNRDEVCSKFLESLPFELYPFQEEALLAWFESTGGVMVCAPTGMGKTLIAEAALFEALHTRQRLYYTTPLIALTDQKFREFQDLAERWGFSREDIGLITGNRRVNPDAIIRVVVAEILLNHLLSPDPAVSNFDDVASVVMDEFHSFNDPERGVVWELSLVLLPRHTRVMLLSATVGNPHEFASWLRAQHGRDLKVVLSNERRVPLEFNWIGDKLLTEQLPEMVTDDDATNRVPALVFCFNRDECWEVAERLKGLPLIGGPARAEIEAYLNERKADFAEGVGPKLKQMLIRGVGVHHAGVLPKHKEVVEELFNRKLVPFVICTETLAAGINLPARSVVLSTLLKGKRGEKKLVPSSIAHQIFGRAGRPQFDKQGYVFVLAHEDDARLVKWKRKYEQLGDSKDPGILRIKKELERKKPTRRKTEQYWSEGQFKQLIEAGPAKLFSRSMIPYSVLIYLLTKMGTLQAARSFLSRRFNTAERIASFQEQLDFMINNLAGLGYLTRSEDGDQVTLHDSIHKLLNFRSIDPLYGAFLTEQLVYSNFEEKVLALESVLEVPPTIVRKVRIPELPPGPLQTQVLEPMLVQMGALVARPTGAAVDEELADEDDFFDEEEQERPPTFPEMLKLVFESRLAAPEPVFVQPKWIGGGVAEAGGDFYRFVKSRELIKQEGLILRHLLRLTILAGEMAALTEDPDYIRIGEVATNACSSVDPRYTARFLEQAEAVKKMATV